MKRGPQKLTYTQVKDQKLIENGRRHTRLEVKYFRRFRKELKEEFGFDIDTCSVCGIKDWNNKKIIMELDHLNGIVIDGRIENLSWKCPNCHSQTANFRNRKVSIDKRIQQLNNS